MCQFRNPDIRMLVPIGYHVTLILYMRSRDRENKNADRSIDGTRHDMSSYLFKTGIDDCIQNALTMGPIHVQQNLHLQNMKGLKILCMHSYILYT